jgi:hypothetical protein
MQAIADCGLAAYGNLPIFCEFYNRMNTGYQKKSKRPKFDITQTADSGLEFMAIGCSFGYQSPGELARASFFKAFDITPDTQIAIERYYQSGEPLVFTPGPVELYYNSPSLYSTSPEYIK